MNISIQSGNLHILSLSLDKMRKTNNVFNVHKLEVNL